MKHDPLSRYVQNYFMSYLISQRGYGDNTVASYRDTFKLLFEYLKANSKAVAKLRLADLDRACILQFLQHLETERKNSAATRNVRLAHFKSFFGYVLSETPEMAEHCSQVINIPFKKTEKRPPAYLTETETKAFLQTPDKSSSIGLRHMAILSLLYDSACRVSELIGLNVSDVTLGRICRLYVKGKGDKFREIPILPETGNLLRQYIAACGLRPEQPLFISKQGNRLTRAGVAYIMSKYLQMAKNQDSGFMPDKISPHRMRNSKATHLVNHGVNIYDIRDFLGHVSVVTTQIYLTSNPETTRAAIENAALRIVPDSTDFYSPEEKSDLMEFLANLV